MTMKRVRNFPSASDSASRSLAVFCGHHKVSACNVSARATKPRLFLVDQVPQDKAG
jgi:hypothetical protein